MFIGKIRARHSPLNLYILLVLSFSSCGDCPSSRHGGRHLEHTGAGERVCGSVGDPDPEPHVFEPSGSGSICQRYGSGRIRLRIHPFSHIGVEQTEIILAK